MHIALHDIQLHCWWIPTEEHAPADVLSRWDTEKIGNLHPNLLYKQTQSQMTCQKPGTKTAPSPPQAAPYLWWGLSSLTWRTYTTPKNNIVHFCAVQEITPILASGELHSLWASKLGERSLRTNTIKSYLSCLMPLHNDLRLRTESFDNQR